ncbi:hypothetical protein HPB48_023640 [Haemaphysalis longicornis]|uniref:Endonuclease-reverse transcriptase n=1 Tax=Haemaphysalis longicornis TaxID=44386 RepID=A0A9J6H8F4_HAELO|nr:hypothetical protein HPB48_023640 [Haemaphysalis longicornis]
MKSIPTSLSQHEKTLNNNISRLTKIENDCSTLASLKTQVDDIQTLAATNANVIDTLTDRFDSTEDRARRSNLLFFGFDDDEKETRSQFEQLLLKLCNETLQVSLDPRSVERGHRIGRFQPDQKRRIVVRFSHYEDKENGLLKAKKLKNSDYSIGQDCSPNTRYAQERLIKFGKSQSKLYKLHHDKLLIDKTTYVFDRRAQKVVPRPQ